MKFGERRTPKKGKYKLMSNLEQICMKDTYINGNIVNKLNYISESVSNFVHWGFERDEKEGVSWHWGLYTQCKRKTEGSAVSYALRSYWY